MRSYQRLMKKKDRIGLRTDSMVEPELTEEEIRVAKEIERHRFSD